MPEDKKTLDHDALLDAKPKDRMASIIQQIVTEGRRGLTALALAHHEALMNSLAVSPAETFVTQDAPYGQRPYPYSTFYQNRALGQIVSPFSAEQVNAITTRLVGPLLGQREVLYIEPQGMEDQQKAKVQERLWDLAIHSRYTNWAELCWRTGRDVVVRSRAFWKVSSVKMVRKRRVYIYGDPLAMQKLVDAGIPPDEVQMLASTIRTSTVEPVTLWDGPVITSIPFGMVFKDKSESVLTDSSLYTIEERRLPYQQFLAEGRALFGPGSEVKFDSSRVVTGYIDTHGSEGFFGVPFGIQYGTDPETRIPNIYEPVRFFEFRGIDPIGDPTVEKIAWVTDGATVGMKDHDGSGPAITISEWAWDPITGMATSGSPLMLIRTVQEMLSLLSNCGLNAALWDSILSGGINTDVVSSVDQVRKLRPGQFFNLAGDGQALQPIQLAKNPQMIEQLIRSMEDAARLVTTGGSSVVGTAPQGVGTLGEFSGVTQGLMDRIGTQSEINADVALRRTFHHVIATWRDVLVSDQDLQATLGQNEETLQATLQDLDGQMDVIPMAARYHQVRQASVTAITALLDRAATDPQLMARLKPEVYDALAYAIAGPESRRWFATSIELQQQGIDPRMLQQQAIQNASQPSTLGKPSPPKQQPTTGAEQVVQQGGQ